MQKRRVIPVVVGAVLCLGAFAAAQGQPLTTHADNVAVGPTQTTLSGNVVVVVNGVVMRADRAVIQDGEITLEGDVRVTVPRRISLAAQTTRQRITPPPPIPYSVETPKIDTPLPEPWQPPPRNQR
jgi:lipopolysaccharide export system protein LptA